MHIVSIEGYTAATRGNVAGMPRLMSHLIIMDGVIGLDCLGTDCLTMIGGTAKSHQPMIWHDI